MLVQDLYYKKYLKYKNKYLELKQYGAGPLEEAKARIKDRVREDEEGSKLITACKEFFVWPTSKVASQRKEDDEYVAKNDKSVTFDYKEDDINTYIENNKKRFEEKIKRLEENKIKFLKMQEIDNKVLNVTGPSFSTYVKKIIDIINFNPDKEQMVKSKIISTGEVQYMKFKNYLEAVQYVRWHYDSKTDSGVLDDHTKWIITDIGTNTVINRDFFYDERNKDTPDAADTPDTDDFYKVKFLHDRDESDSDND